MTESPRGLPVKETIRLQRVRKAMAQTMKASVDNAALSQVSREVDVTSLQQMRSRLQRDRDMHVSLNAMMMVALAQEPVNRN